MAADRSTDRIDTMQAMFACIAYIESEAMEHGLRDVARYMRLGLVELQTQFRSEQEQCMTMADSIE